MPMQKRTEHFAKRQLRLQRLACLLSVVVPGRLTVTMRQLRYRLHALRWANRLDCLLVAGELGT